MKPKVTFTADRHKVTEGDIVELRWNCPTAQSASLTINNGYRSSSIPIEPSGSKKFRLNRSKGRTKITLNAILDGHSYSQQLYVRVKPLKPIKAEQVDDRGRKINPLNQLWRNIKAATKNLRTQYHLLPKHKQQALTLLSLLALTLLLSSFNLLFGTLGLVAISAYLIFVILKKS